MSGFRLGFQTHVHGTGPASEILPGIVDLFVAAEELGYGSGWIAQHHLGNDAGRLPSPLVLLGAAAERTGSIRLGTTVVVLPLEDPVRLAEDAAVLDALSGGRVELGLGTGGPSEPEFAAFGKDPARRRELYAANLARLLEVLGDDGLPEGLRLNPDGRGLLGRIWESPTSPERAAAAGSAGHGLLIGGGPAELAVVEGHAAAHAAAGLAGPPRVGVFRGAFPGPDRETQRDLLWDDLKRVLDSPAAQGHFPAEPGREELLDALHVNYGTADEVADSILADPILPFATDVVLAVQSASTPVDTALATLETLAREVAPRLGWSPAETTERTLDA